MPALPTYKRFVILPHRPEESHVPAEVFAHRPQDTFGPVIQAGGFVQGVGHGEPGVAMLLGPLRFGDVSQIGREQRRAFGRDAGDGEFNREFGSVRSEGREFQPLAEDRTFARGKVVGHALR